MKQTVAVLLFFFSLTVNGTDKPGRLITETFLNQPLKEVLGFLKEKYNLRIAYSDKLVRDISISVTIEKATIPEAFSKLFSESNLSFEYIAPGAIIVKKPDPNLDSFNLNGEIVDAITGERLPFVYLFIQPDNKSISSNEDGIFSINNVTLSTAILLSYIGYRDSIIYLDEQSKNRRLKIALKPQANNLEEVIITSEDNNDFQPISSSNVISINAKFAAQVPQSAEPDVFRTMQMLPGVTATNELSSGLYINGGTANQNLVLFDGIPIYHVDHFFGYFSAINPFAIQTMRLFKGGFDAKYGGRASSLVEFIGKDGNSEKTSGNISFNLLSANTSLEVPVNETTTLFLSARRSYTDVFKTSLFNNIFSIYETTNFDETPNALIIDEFNVEPEFYYTDLNFKVSTKLGLKNRLSLSYYDSNDILNYDEYLKGEIPGDTTIINSSVGFINWGNVGASMKLSRLWNTRHFTNLLVSYSFYESEFEERNTTTLTDKRETYVVNSIADIDQDNYIKDFTVKLDHEWMIGLNRLEFGAAFSRFNTRISSLQNDSIITFKEQLGSIVFTQYIQNKYALTSNTELSVGLRGNFLSNTNEYNFEPRVSLNHRFNAAWTWYFSTGVYRQFVNQINTSNALQGSRDLWLLSDFEIPSQKSAHYMTGFSRDVNNSTISLSGFYKSFDGLLDYAFRQGNLITEYEDYEEQFFEGQGRARGLEVLIKQRIGDFMGWASYTLSKTEYRFDQLNSGKYYPADHDQTHELNLFGSYQIGKLTLFSTWYYGSGRPYSNLDALDNITKGREANKKVIRLKRAQKNNFRFPAYHRLDLGANYLVPLGQNSLRISGKISNVYNRRNVYDRKVEFTEVSNADVQSDPRKRIIRTVVDIELMGITPSLSLEFSF